MHAYAAITGQDWKPYVRSVEAPRGVARQAASVEIDAFKKSCPGRVGVATGPRHSQVGAPANTVAGPDLLGADAPSITTLRL